MRKSILSRAAFTALCACLALVLPARAGQNGIPVSTSSVKAAQPPAQKRAGRPAAEDALSKQLRKSLESFIKDSARENDGLYAAEDPDSEETWMLEFRQAGVDKPRKVSNDEFIVRAEFVRKGDPEFGEEDLPVIADFTLSREDARWTVSDEVIFSIAGKERFTYTPENLRQPIVRPGAEGEPGEEDMDEGGAPAGPRSAPLSPKKAGKI